MSHPFFSQSRKVIFSSHQEEFIRCHNRRNKVMTGSQLPPEFIGWIHDRIDLSAKFFLDLGDGRHDLG